MFNSADHKNMLFLDIETTTEYELLEELMNTNHSKYLAFIKKADWYLKNEYGINPKDATIGDYQLIYQERGPLFPEFSKIICVSMGGFSEGTFKKISFMDDNEVNILNKVSSFLTKKEEKTPATIIVGYNIMAFDIPFLIKRMIINNIEVPNILKIYDKKPWDLTAKFKDIFLMWQMGSKNYISFDLLCNTLGVKSPKEELDGSMIYSYYYQIGNKESIQNYCESDIEALSNVVLRLTD